MSCDSYYPSRAEDIMGQDINSSAFSERDFEEFRANLRAETSYLLQQIKANSFDTCENLQVGLELETWLANEEFLPAPENNKFLAAMNHPNVVPELSKFNAEINAVPHHAGPGFLTSMLQELDRTWASVQGVCRDLDLNMLMIGSMPTLRDDMLTTENMSDSARYRALNEQVFALRRGHPVTLNIQGREQLFTRHKDIMLEAAATSLQIHLRPPREQIVRYFNASYLAAVPLVAIAANTPYLFGKELWEETRIPIFEQGVFVPSFKNQDGSIQTRVTFGSGYVRQSMMELFLENLNAYPVLLPVVSHAGREQLMHVRLHNGNIWRWNRPIVGVESDGRTHLRVEQRVPAAGPTLVDMMANLAFYVGLTHHLAQDLEAPEQRLPFELLRSSFYRAAQFGLEATVEWMDDQQVLLQTLLQDDLIPRAKSGLLSIGVDDDEAEYYLEDIVAERVRSGRTGAAWQRSYIATHGGDFHAMTAAYFERQERGEPVHTWLV